MTGNQSWRGSFLLAGAVAVLTLSILPAVALADEASDVVAARAGTKAFVDVEAAEAAGYGLPPEGPLHECISSLDDTGAMGLHYINGDLVGDALIDPAKPEALVYAPTAGGGRKLVALEYVVFAEAWDAENAHPPMLFDQMFMLVDEPNRYELPAFYALHAWLYQDNPAGTYAGFNPNVGCQILPDTAAGPLQPAQPDPEPGLPALTLLLLALAGLAGALTARRVLA